MCGICAYIGRGNASEAIWRAIYALQNRGYDSMGVAHFSPQGDIIVRKKASTEQKSGIEWMREWCLEEGEGPMMGHARWATCGAKSDANSHPHLCWRGEFALVHNGIIENYHEIRDELTERGVTFSSETDSEVIVNLISHYATKGRAGRQTEESEAPLAPEEAIRRALGRLEGTWGIVVMCRATPDRLYCARHGSPLLIGFGDGCLMVSSEQSGFANYANNYICLRDNDIVILTDKAELIKGGDYEVRPVTCDEIEFSPDPFPYWTLREIYEQPDSARRALSGGGRILSPSTVRLGGLSEHRAQLDAIDHLILLGCGTSYNAGMYSLETFRKIAGFTSVQIFDGADFEADLIPSRGQTGLLLLSQSGETKDLHRALEIGRALSLPMIGVVNCVDSLIAREVNCGVYLNAGREVGVASTKSFTSQVIVLSLIACWFSQGRGLAQAERERLIEGLRALPRDIEETIANTKAKRVAELLQTQRACPPFILGKGEGEAIAREGALKIKEVSYIRAEAYPTSSLKHGPYSCLEEGGPVILIAPRDRHLPRAVAIYDELKARGAFVITIGVAPGDIVLPLQQNRYFEPLLAAIHLQLIAYYTALALERPIDFPRGIAKCVTTD